MWREEKVTSDYSTAFRTSLKSPEKINKGSRTPDFIKKKESECDLKITRFFFHLNNI